MAARTPSGGDSDRSFAYLFEAKGIQRYVLDSGLLRDLVGASDMVAGLADSGGEEDLVRQVISAAIPDGERPEFSRRAGGSFSLHSENRERLDQVRALWRLVAMLRCPGLEMADSLGQADGPNNPLGALERAYERASGLRDNTVADLPPFGGPVTEFVRRTGRPATGTKAYSAEEAPIQLDAVTEPQRDSADSRRDRGLGRNEETRNPNDGARGRLALRFLPDHPEDGGPPYRFPRNYAAGEEDEPDNPLFPFLPTDTRIAVIHADLSGLGQTYSKAGERVRERDGGPQELLKLSESIEAAIAAAAKGATMRVLLPHAKERGDHKEEARDRVVPARPVLLGGDDITIIVRADLALRFAEDFWLRSRRNRKTGYTSTGAPSKVRSRSGSRPAPGSLS